MLNNHKRIAAGLMCRRALEGSKEGREKLKARRDRERIKKDDSLWMSELNGGKMSGGNVSAVIAVTHLP